MIKTKLSTAAEPEKVMWTRIAAVFFLLALIVLGILWEMWLAPIKPGGSWVVLKVLPLFIPLAGLFKNRLYTYRWVSLFVWLYVIEGVVRAWSDQAPSNYLAMVEVCLCLALFTAVTVHVRLRLQAAKQAQILANQLGVNTEIDTSVLS